jgi:predicted GNAT family N-acyltransferase
MREPADATGFGVRVADWTRDAAALRDVRYEVFVVEQRVPESLEWDGIDDRCVHALAVDGSGHVIGCGRLLPDGHIGRMAVRAPWRGRGVGRAMLDLLIGLARQRGDARVVLNAQTQAMSFYARAGFVPSGPEFDEAGIPHREMALRLR